MSNFFITKIKIFYSKLLAVNGIKSSLVKSRVELAQAVRAMDGLKEKPIYSIARPRCFTFLIAGIKSVSEEIKIAVSYKLS